MLSRSVRISFFLWLFFTTAIGLFLLSSMIVAAHASGDIQYISSDASTYFSLYQDIYADTASSEDLGLFLIGSPILLLKVMGGEIVGVLLLNLALVLAALHGAIAVLPDTKSRVIFLLGALLFPYLSLGFLSLNKEVYAMCSAIYFCTYYVRGRFSHLFLALLLAAFARYYMLVSLLMLVVFVPRLNSPRYKSFLCALLLFSLAGPLYVHAVPQYSSEDVLNVAGATAVFFSEIINHFGYFLIYPVKYLALVPQRAYALVLDSGRAADFMEALVSILTMVVMFPAFLLLLKKNRRADTPRGLVWAGIFAPMPMMWSDIMHWRYFSYVYFFFLFALCLNGALLRKRLPINE